MPAIPAAIWRPEGGSRSVVERFVVAEGVAIVVIEQVPGCLQHLVEFASVFATCRVGIKDVEGRGGVAILPIDILP